VELAMKTLLLLSILSLPLQARESCTDSSASFSEIDKCMKDCVADAKREREKEIKACGNDKDGNESSEEVESCKKKVKSDFLKAKEECEKV